MNGDDISDAQLGSLTLKTMLQPSLCLLLLDYSCQICVVLWAGAVLLSGRGLALLESPSTTATLGKLKCVQSGL